MAIKKNRKKHSLSEGFLDGEEEVTSTTEDVQPEVSDESEDEAEGAPIEDDETDLSDEGATEDDSLDSDGDGEPDDNASDEEAGVEDEPEEKSQNLEDQIASLITSIQGLTDQMAKQNQPAEEEETTDDASLESDTDEPAEDDTTDDAEAAEPEDDSDYEGDESDEESESSDEGSDESSDEESDSDEGGEEEEEAAPPEASECFKPMYKRGGLLHEDSGTLLGKLVHNRYDQLHDIVMAIVEGKIHQRIEGAKKEFRAESYTKIYGED